MSRSTLSFVKIFPSPSTAPRISADVCHGKMESNIYSVCQSTHVLMFSLILSISQCFLCMFLVSSLSCISSLCSTYPTTPTLKAHPTSSADVLHPYQIPQPSYNPSSSVVDNPPLKTLTAVHLLHRYRHTLSPLDPLL